MATVTMEMEGKDLERVLGQLGVTTTYIDGVSTPQEFRFNFSGGWYTKTAVKRAMDFLNCKYGYKYELNASGGFIVTRQKQNRQFVSCAETVTAIKEAVANVSENESKVAQAQTEYDNAIKQANESHSTADVSKATAAQTALLKAQSELKQAEADLKDSKTSYKYSCEGYAWNLAIVGIKASDTTNYAVNNSLEFLMSTEMTALDTATAPTWYSQIVNSIKSITGIDIKTGA